MPPAAVATARPAANGTRATAVEETPAAADAPADPWSGLAPDGAGLSVHDFLTTSFSQTTNRLRRAITLPYVARFGLGVSEWRVLSVLAHRDAMPFAELAEQAAADKAQVSRVLQVLAGRGLVETRAQGAARRHGTMCHMTDEGRRLYAQIMPLARRSQAAMILQLDRDERRVLYGALQKLRALCAGAPAGESDAD